MWAAVDAKDVPQIFKIIINEVPMARHGPILRESEATASRIIFKYLPGPVGPLLGPKIAVKKQGRVE